MENKTHDTDDHSVKQLSLLQMFSFLLELRYVRACYHAN